MVLYYKLIRCLNEDVCTSESVKAYSLEVSGEEAIFTKSREK